MEAIYDRAVSASIAVRPTICDGCGLGGVTAAADQRFICNGSNCSNYKLSPFDIHRDIQSFIYATKRGVKWLVGRDGKYNEYLPLTRAHFSTLITLHESYNADLTLSSLQRLKPNRYSVPFWDERDGDIMLQAFLQGHIWRIEKMIYREYVSKPIIDPDTIMRGCEIIDQHLYCKRTGIPIDVLRAVIARVSGDHAAMSNDMKQNEEVDRMELYVMYRSASAAIKRVTAEKDIYVLLCDEHGKIKMLCEDEEALERRSVQMDFWIADASNRKSTCVDTNKSDRTNIDVDTVESAMSTDTTENAIPIERSSIPGKFIETYMVDNGIRTLLSRVPI
jgi:hypothetical protein